MTKPSQIQTDLSIVGIRVTYVTSLVAAFPDLKQTALQVVLQLAQAPMKALCSESSSDVTTRTHLVRPLEKDNFPLFNTSWWNFGLSLCTLQLLSISSPVGPSCSRPIISTTSIVTRPRTSSWSSCPLSIFSFCVAPSPSLVVRSASSKVHSYKVTRRQLHGHVASVPESTRDRQRTATHTRRLSSGTSALTMYTSSSASEVMNACMAI